MVLAADTNFIEIGVKGIGKMGITDGGRSLLGQQWLKSKTEVVHLRKGITSSWKHQEQWNVN